MQRNNDDWIIKLRDGWEKLAEWETEHIEAMQQHHSKIVEAIQGVDPSVDAQVYVENHVDDWHAPQEFRFIATSKTDDDVRVCFPRCPVQCCECVFRIGW